MFLGGMSAQKHRGHLGQTPSMWEDQGKIWKRKKYHCHMGKAANKDNRLRGTDEGGAHHHNNKPNNSERWNFCFCFHLSFFLVLSLSLLLLEDKLWVFHSHQQAVWLWGVQLLRDKGRMGSPRGVLGRLGFCPSPSLVKVGKRVACSWNMNMAVCAQRHEKVPSDMETEESQFWSLDNRKFCFCPRIPHHIPTEGVKESQ